MATQKQANDTHEEMEVDGLKSGPISLETIDTEVTESNRINNVGQDATRSSEFAEDKGGPKEAMVIVKQENNHSLNNNTNGNGNINNSKIWHNSGNNLHSAGVVKSYVTPRMLVMDDEKSPALPCSRRRTFSSGSQSSTTSLNVDCGSPSPSPRSIGSPAPRVIQIRREESMDELTREVAKERDVTSAINLSRSLDETSWLGDKNFMTTLDSRDSKRDSMDEVLFNPSVSSPVRFIEKLHQNRSLTPSPIGVPISPKQRTYRRSLSPSQLRPSLLTSKRKLDAEDCDSFNPSPAKRPANSFYSPVSTLSSVSSSSSPDHLSDSNLNRFSCDDDSGNENAFLPSVSQQTSLNAITPVNTPLSCDTRTTHSFAFMKPRYIAPQSPLAAGVSSASMVSDTNRKGSVNGQSYSFAPVKD